MIRLTGFLRGAHICSSDGSLSAADRLRRAEIVVGRHRDSDVGPPRGPAARTINQRPGVRSTVFLNRPKIRIIHRINGRRAVITPPVMTVAVSLPIAVFPSLVIAHGLHGVLRVVEGAESVVGADILSAGETGEADEHVVEPVHGDARKGVVIGRGRVFDAAELPDSEGWTHLIPLDGAVRRATSRRQKCRMSEPKMTVAVYEVPDPGIIVLDFHGRKAQPRGKVSAIVRFIVVPSRIRQQKAGAAPRVI